MGACQSQNTETGELTDPIPPPQNKQKSEVNVKSDNPFYDFDSMNPNEHSKLSKYKFHSKYNDNFLGKCSELQQISTGNIYLSKQFTYSKEEKMKQQLLQFQTRKQKLTSENVIQIKDVIATQVDGFFGDKQKIFLILDYPFINFVKQISNRLTNKISFSHEEINHFVCSTVKGYNNIDQAGFKTDKVRLKNIFFGIKNRQSIIKVAQTNLIAPKSNYEYFYEKGPNKKQNKDIYLSPEQFQAWKNGEKNYVSSNKSGVFSLGMCILDLTTMDPSKQAYHYTQKMIDSQEIQNRIQITGKKYGTGLQRILRDMLEFDIHKRSSFEEIEQQLPTISKTQQSKMHLSVIPNQRTSIINNDNSNLKSSKMFKSVVSQQQNLGGSRVYSSRIKLNRKDQELDSVIQNYTNGNKYSGQKKGDLKHGKGKYIFRDGSYYEGDWEENKILGVGNLYFSSGMLEYSGQWRNDQFNGWGTQYANIQKGDNWEKYQGEFKNGVREGRGKMIFQDGTIYDGQFRGGKICGRGRKISPDGQIKTGFWNATTPDYFLKA